MHLALQESRVRLCGRLGICLAFPLRPRTRPISQIPADLPPVLYVKCQRVVVGIWVRPTCSDRERVGLDFSSPGPLTTGRLLKALC